MSPEMEKAAKAARLSPYGDGTPLKPRATVIPRCRECGRRLAEYVGLPWSIRCHSCKTENRSA